MLMGTHRWVTQSSTVPPFVLILSLSPSPLLLSLSFFLLPVVLLSHVHTHFLSLSLVHWHTQFLLTFSHTYSLPLSLSLSLSLSRSPTYTSSLIFLLTSSHMYVCVWCVTGRVHCTDSGRRERTHRHRHTPPRRRSIHQLPIQCK